jgi:uncharacterized YigZ family protein
LHRDTWIAPTVCARATLTEKKSTFIARIAPIASTRDAEDLILNARSEYPDARHHVYAWRLCGDVFLQRYSDDGEPQGTAGLPVLDVLRKNNIEDAAIVVTRYFGGTLLGTGGLVRAYSRSAFQALSLSNPMRYTTGDLFSVSVSYSNLDRLRHALLKAGFPDREPQFGELACFQVFAPAGREDELRKICLDVTSGQVTILHLECTAMPSAKIDELICES